MIDFENEHLAMLEQRVAVLTEIEKVLFTKRYRLSQKHLNIFTVQSIAMIYSIWEGYVQESFQLYIRYINSLNINFSELSDEIVVFHMDNSFKQFHQYPQKNTGKVKFYEGLKKHFLESHHQLYQRVDTESNLGFDVLNKLLSQFSLETLNENWEQYRKPNTNLKEMMSDLLRYRNGVAHGGDISSEEKVTQTVYNKYRQLVNDLMYEMHNRFMLGIENETYRKKSIECVDS